MNAFTQEHFRRWIVCSWSSSMKQACVKPFANGGTSKNVQLHDGRSLTSV
jgi:hypothetical protein